MRPCDQYPPLGFFIGRHSQQKHILSLGAGASRIHPIEQIGFAFGVDMTPFNFSNQKLVTPKSQNEQVQKDGIARAGSLEV